MATPGTRKSRRSNRGYNILGARIRVCRASLVPQVTQNDLAARLSVRGLAMDRPTITRIENGQRFLRDYEIRVIAKALGVSVARLFDEA